MNYLRIIFASAALAFLMAGASHAADVKIIVNESVAATSITADELKGVFLATQTSLRDGSHVVPVLEKGGPAHEAILKEYLGKTDAGLDTYFRSLVFGGKASMPRVFAADSEVVAYVAKTRNAIGYVSPDAVTEGVKILEMK